MASFPHLLLAAAVLCRVRFAVAAPQEMVSSIPPSPTGLDCTLYQGHWDCTTPCTTYTTTRYGIMTTVTDLTSWRSSMNSVYSSSGVRFSGASIPVFTSTATFANGGGVTLTAYYNSAALSSAGYTITDTIITTVSCPRTTPTLAPSPTGSLCSPHGDHWHCEPYPSTSIGSSSVITGECEPHGDHWHCPPGVPEPTTPPPLQPTGTTTQPPTGECEPHGDHWHCPPGVPEPTTPPPLQPTGTTTQPPTGECEPHGDHWHCQSGVPEPTTPPSSQPTGGTATQPPAGECEPHGDHWHCQSGVPEPTTPPSSQPTGGMATQPPAGECEPHGDHWHCPSGVPEPTTPPASQPTDNTVTQPPAGECEPHGDHWHCPSGVPEPTTPPASRPTDSTATQPSAGECEPHGDHWHCPPGAPEPTTTPGQSHTESSKAAGARECEPHGDHWHCPPGVPEPSAPPAVRGGDNTLTTTVIRPSSVTDRPSAAVVTAGSAGAVAATTFPLLATLFVAVFLGAAEWHVII